MRGRRYATGTEVTILESQDHTRSVIRKYGGDRYQHFLHGNRAVYQFDFAGYTISFGFLLKGDEEEHKRIYRCVFATIKAKLISVVENIESPAQAFAPHIVGDDGDTLEGKIIPLLPKRR